ncbi:MAG: hypothetical protein QXG52_01250 [Candidatus Caldarchaeum sp.]
MAEPAYFAVAVIGLLHGLEPGHGWPVAMIYAVRSSNPLLRGFAGGMVISFFHLISSLAVVGAYVILKTFTYFTIPFVNYVAGTALLILGIKFLLEKSHDEQQDYFRENFGWRLHEHKHPNDMTDSRPHYNSKKASLSLSGLAAFAFVLGFAHEEEFALLAFVVGGVEPLTLMTIYAASVAAGLVGVTLLAVKAYTGIEQKFKKHASLLPKISGVILIATAASFILGIR